MCRRTSVLRVCQVRRQNLGATFTYVVASVADDLSFGLRYALNVFSVVCSCCSWLATVHVSRGTKDRSLTWITKDNSAGNLAHHVCWKHGGGVVHKLTSLAIT